MENNIKFTDSCQNNVNCENCCKRYMQCFGVSCPDFEPFIEITNSEI